MLGASRQNIMTDSITNQDMTLYVRDFTLTPGPRLEEDGKYSGEEFREKYLLPKFREAVKMSVPLNVNLEETKGYASSFLEEAFGGLIRKGCKKKEVKKYLRVHSIDRPWYVPEVYRYIDEA